MKKCSCHSSLAILVLSNRLIQYERMSLFLFVILLAFSAPLMCVGQEVDSIELARQDSLAITEADNFVTASILTATPSDVLYSCAGHASIRMQCPYYDLDMVYTYESENVTDKVLSFFEGNLKMGMTAVPAERVLADYKGEGRGITEYVLNIPLENRKQLWQYLDGKVEEGMNLPYDYLNRSCALMCLRAVCIAVKPDTLNFGKWDERLVKESRRALLGDIIGDFPWNRFFLFTIIGTEADQPCSVEDKVVLPPDLIAVLQKATFNGQPVLKESSILVTPNDEIKQSSWHPTPVMLACVLLLFAIISCFCLQQTFSILLLTIQSAFGLFISYLVFISTLPVSNFSWLIIPFNLLPLLLWHWRKWWLLPFAVICFVWSIVMLARIGNPLVDNAHIVLALALVINYIGQWLQIRKQTKHNN